MMFVLDELLRYSKQMLLEDIGVEGQQKIKQAKVAVIGAGGLGCPLLQYLNATGVGTIALVEFDVIDPTNLHRQVLYNPVNKGSKKAELAIEKLSKQNPFTKFIWHDTKLDESNAIEILSAYDLIIDGCDNFKTRYIINDACLALNRPLVYGSILGYQGQLAVFNYKGSKHLRHIFPEPPNAEDVPNCSENGVLGTVPGIIGTMMAQMALDVILERSALSNQFILFDTRSFDKTTLHL